MIMPITISSVLHADAQNTISITNNGNQSSFNSSGSLNDFSFPPILLKLREKRAIKTIQDRMVNQVLQISQPIKKMMN
jgi:hypothetical protein